MIDRHRESGIFGPGLHRAAPLPETTMRPILLAVAGLGLALSGCQTQTASAPPAPSPQQAAPGVTPNTFRMPAGAGCSGEVERFQAVIDNDLDTGHTTKSVHDRVSGEIARARTTCSAGNDAAATGQIRATKAKFGYPG